MLTCHSVTHMVTAPVDIISEIILQEQEPEV